MATFIPIKEASKIKDAISIIGEANKKEKVTPSGSPLDVKPINSGMLEQLQKGVIPPRQALKIFPAIPLTFPKTFFVFSGGKNDCRIPTKNIRTDIKMKILVVSNRKKWSELVNRLLEA